MEMMHIYHIREYPIARHSGEVPTDQAEERFKVADDISHKA